ncbi:MAG: hypothetical protein AAF449_17010 [Myxococcota bacterium]
MIVSIADMDRIIEPEGVIIVDADVCDCLDLHASIVERIDIELTIEEIKECCSGMMGFNGRLCCRRSIFSAPRVIAIQKWFCSVKSASDNLIALASSITSFDASILSSKDKATIGLGRIEVDVSNKVGKIVAGRFTNI